MAKITPIGQPNNDGERKAIAYLRDHLPDDYRVLHNFELKKGKLWYEVDVTVIAPHAVYVVVRPTVDGSHRILGIRDESPGDGIIARR